MDLYKTFGKKTNALASEKPPPTLPWRFWPPKDPPSNPSGSKWMLGSYYGVFWCMYNFYIIFEIFYNFFQTSLTPGYPWGGPRGPGGAPPRGYPTWVPSSNNLNILRFWNILESLFRQRTPHNNHFASENTFAGHWETVVYCMENIEKR